MAKLGIKFQVSASDRKYGKTSFHQGKLSFFDCKTKLEWFHCSENFRTFVPYNANDLT